jgi:hypothetical protein
MRFTFLSIASLLLLSNSVNSTRTNTKTNVGSHIEECPVCMDTLVQRHTVHPPCNHKICSSCYDGVFQHQTNPSCPLCRASYTEVHPYVEQTHEHDSSPNNSDVQINWTQLAYASGELLAHIFNYYVESCRRNR